MPIFGNSNNKKASKSSTDFEATVVDTAASDIVSTPSGKVGDTLSLWNDGPAAVRIAFDADATQTTGILVNSGEGYSEADITVNTRVSAIAVTGTGVNAQVRGVLWST